MYKLGKAHLTIRTTKISPGRVFNFRVQIQRIFSQMYHTGVTSIYYSQKEERGKQN